MTTKPHLVLRRSRGNGLFPKAIIVLMLCLFVAQASMLLGPIATFIGFDLIISVYLTSLFSSKLRFLFLLHPLISLISSYGFEMPFTEIGVAYTYLNNFETFVNPTTLAPDANLLLSTLFPQGPNDDANFGIGVAYVGVIPILLLPKYLFADAPEVSIYLSLGVFTVLYAAIAVTVAISLDALRKDVLLPIALYFTVSPTFLEMNASLHRYGLLFLGLFLFLIAYVGLSKGVRGFRKVNLFVLMLVSLMLILVSKAPLLLSLIVFVLLDLFYCNKLPLISKIFFRLKKQSKIWFLIVMIALAQYLVHFIAPEKYVTNFSQQGGQYPGLINIPILGLAIRLIYAMLSPFPWINFTQMDLYGYNTLLFLLHIPSALLASWIIFSFFLRAPQILSTANDIRMSVMFGVAIMSSLAFSAIGFHVYLAPALPFMAIILLDKKNRVSLIYPLCFILIMELIAQIAQLIR
jgi:hypothetical protein